MAGAGLLALAFLTFFALRPTAILGIDGGALHDSVGGSVTGESCRRLHDQIWTCPRAEAQGASGDVPYRVEVDGLGCWNATRSGGYDPEAGPKHLSGCITIANYIRS
jgi:hypothetical protein